MAILGQTITLNEELHRVIGVMPPRTFFPERNTQIWAPLAFSPEQLRDCGSHNYLVYGRLKPDVTLAQANVEMGVVGQSIAEPDAHHRGSGAQPRDLLLLILEQGMRLALVGLAIGLVAALPVSRLMSSLLYNLSATDPTTFAAVALLLAAVALLACYVPARRATRVDPVVALRND